MDTESTTVLYEKPIVKEDPLVDGTALHYVYPPQQSIVIIPNQCHHQMIKATDDGSDLPISLTTLTKFTSLMMAVILLSCGYQACESGRYQCNL